MIKIAEPSALGYLTLAALGSGWRAKTVGKQKSLTLRDAFDIQIWDSGIFGYS